MKLNHFKSIFIYVVLQSFVNARIEIFNSNDTIEDDFENRYATYLEYDLKGYMEAGVPSDACTEMRPPTFPHDFNMSKIVLVNGTSKCDFMTKVKNAEEVGYDAVMLYDPFPGSYDYPNLTFPLGNELNVSVVLVLCEDAKRITKFLYNKSEEKFIIQIQAFWPNVFLIYIYTIFFGITGFVISYSITKWICKKCFCRSVEENDNDQQAEEIIERVRNMMVSLLEGQRELAEARCQRGLRNIDKKFPPKQFSEENEEEQCAICMNEFEIGERVRELRCHHVFHSECIDEWLKTKYGILTCPLCVKEYSLQTSCSQSLVDADEYTPLLNAGETSGAYDGSGHTGAMGDECFETPVGSVSDFIYGSESRDLLPRAQGSVNSV